MNELAIRELACAVVLQAVKDYFGRKSTPKKRTKILKELRSSWMRNFSNGTSVNIADELEKHPKEIRARILKHTKRGEELNVYNT